MRRPLGVVVLAVTILALAAPAASAATTEHSSWGWEGPDADVLAPAAAAGIDTVHVHVWPDASGPAWDAFFAEAAAHGLQVHALAGDPSWAQENRDHLLAWVDRVVADGRFDGIVVDIEPYALPAWDHRRDGRRLRDAYLETLELAAARAGGVEFRAVVPFWFDDPAYAHRKRGTLVERVIDAVDGIVVMAYRDQVDGPDGIVELSRFEVDASAAAGKTAVLTVEARDTGIDKVDFSEEGRGALDAALVAVRSAFAGHPGFGGTSIHDLTTYLVLPQ